MEEEMEELYVEGLATHGGPESCVASCEGRGEALTGVRAGRAIEPRNVSSGVPTLFAKRKATSRAALARAVSGPRAVWEPGHVRNLHVREPGEPVSARPLDQRAGRSGNAEAVSLG
jgi:RNA-directed DNA polymerase